jgi:hypothetical protein
MNKFSVIRIGSRLLLCLLCCHLSAAEPPKLSGIGDWSNFYDSILHPQVAGCQRRLFATGPGHRTDLCRCDR